MKYTLALKKNRDFRYIIKKGKLFKGKYLNIYYTVNNNAKNINYLGICVSKKNGNSVSRNKLKRWVREAYKNEEKRIIKNLKIIVLYKKNVLLENINYIDIVEDLKRCFGVLNLYE